MAPTLTVSLDPDGRLWWNTPGRRVPVVSGGDGPTPEPVDLSGLSLDDLTARHAELTTRIEAVDTSSMTLEQARELNGLRTQRNEVATTINEVRALATPAEVVDIVEPTPEPEAAAEAPAPEAPATDPPAADPEPAPEVTDAEREAIAAAAGGPGRPPAAPASPPPLQHAAILASAATGDHHAGQVIDYAELGEMVRQVATSGDSAAPVRVASIEHWDPDAVRIRVGVDAVDNTRALLDGLAAADEAHQARVAAAGAPITAAAGDPCGPAYPYRELPDSYGDSRPFQDLFRVLPADGRGSVAFLRGYSLADVAGAAVEWTSTDQADVDQDDSSTWKPSPLMDCAPTDTVSVYEIPVSMRFTHINTITSPESVANALNAVRSHASRVGEGLALREYDERAHHFTRAIPGDLGAVPQLVQILAHLMGKTESLIREPGEDLSGYVAVFPAGLARTLYADEIAAGDVEAIQQVEADFAARVLAGVGVRSITTPDWAAANDSDPWAGTTLPAVGFASASALPELPNDWTIRLLDPSQGFMLDVGREELSIQPSATLARQNQVQWFGRAYEALGKNGHRPWYTLHVTDLCATGTRSARQDVDCTRNSGS